MLYGPFRGRHKCKKVRRFNDFSIDGSIVVFLYFHKLKISHLRISDVVYADTKNQNFGLLDE